MTAKRFSGALFTVVLVATLFVVPGLAQANIIPIAVGLTEVAPGVFQWDYSAAVSQDQNVESGDFFTIYDFGVSLGFETPTGWTPTTQLVGITPANVTPPDDPAVLNVTFTYSGDTIEGAAELGIFSIFGPVGDPVLGWFAGQGTLNSGQFAGTKSSNTGNVAVPGAARVPEPTTMLLLGAGLIGVGLQLRRSRSAR